MATLKNYKADLVSSLGFSKADISSTTPMMAQYMAVKLEHPDSLVFYRMGDFYELFFEDAKIAARTLNIALTKRGQHKNQDIAMCGVPFHSYESYLTKLIHRGFKVAICEQTETPEQAKARAKKEGGKALVKREVIRIVTQGTLTEDSHLQTKSHNFLCCITTKNDQFGAAIADVSTGLFYTEDGNIRALDSFLEKYNPAEILIAESYPQNIKREQSPLYDKNKMTFWPDTRFSLRSAQEKLKSVYGLKTLDGLGTFSDICQIAAGCLLEYIDLTQKGRLPLLERPHMVKNEGVVYLDAATRRNLEINKTLNGEQKGSLLDCLDQTRTAAGGRLFSYYLNNPLRDIEQINGRLDCIEYFINNNNKRESVQEILKECPDLERCLSRLSLARGGPRDLKAIALAIDTANTTLCLIKKGFDGKINDKNIPSFLNRALDNLNLKSDLQDVASNIHHALKSNLPLLARDGHFIQKGFSPELDHLLALRDDSHKMILKLETEYLKRTGISKLKIKHNNVIGYYIEVNSNQGDALFDDPNKLFIHRQTMANALRFTTVELNDLESKIASAAEKALAVELKLYDELVKKICQQEKLLRQIAKTLAFIDVVSSYAHLAIEKQFCRPTVNNSYDCFIEKGRHPVVEMFLPTGESFIPNNLDFNKEQRLWLLTGPNMAGKSTFLRQNALLIMMAQAGLYVPATQMKIGLVDQIFSRVGASDDLARGQSTFMVEMVETAAILNQATAQSLVILDEIGRGTATFDGLSIAWATLENLHDVNQCRTLFATHYHELTQLNKQLSSLACYTMDIKEWKNDIIFLHEVIKGVANQSYGIHVAELAGLPKLVIGRAKEVLLELENKKNNKNIENLTNSLPLFSSIVERDKAPQPKTHPVIETINNVSLDNLSPKEALDLLYQLKDSLE